MNALERIVEIVNDVEKRGHALNELAEIRTLAQQAYAKQAVYGELLAWKAFSEGHPQLGQDIDVLAGDQPTHAGVVTSLADLGNRWVSITTKSYVSMAVRPDYLWCEHQNDSSSGSKG